jgi:hypothetical protein
MPAAIKLLTYSCLPQTRTAVALGNQPYAPQQVIES